MVDGIAAVLIHVADVEEGIRWYRLAFPDAVSRRSEEPAFIWLQIGTTAVEIVAADAKVGSGPMGSVVYWRVDDIDRAIRHFSAIGADLYRGPLEIEDALWMCQVRDPWGNCIGLRGQRRHQPTGP